LKDFKRIPKSSGLVPDDFGYCIKAKNYKNITIGNTESKEQT